MTEQCVATADQGQPPADQPKRKRKPSSEWKKTVRFKEAKDREPDFISKFELARNLCCHVNTLATWIAEGTIPPPWSKPGSKRPVWLRKHYNVFKRTRKWPEAAYWNRQ